MQDSFQTCLDPKENTPQKSRKTARGGCHRATTYQGMRKNGPMAAHTLILNILPHFGFLRKQILAR